LVYEALLPPRVSILFEALSTPLAVFMMEVCVPLQWRVDFDARRKKCLLVLWSQEGQPGIHFLRYLRRFSKVLAEQSAVEPK
jgi:hypothetical protein